MKQFTTLAIETSCDDTSVAIVKSDGSFFTVEKIVAYSQIDDHQKYGGVVPEIASRKHSEKIIEVLQTIWWDAISKVDCICLTTHPWLPGSLVIGKATATMLSEYFNKPLIPVNHIDGHIFSLFIERDINKIQFPIAILTASWWHNDLYFLDKDEKILTKNQDSSDLLIHEVAGYTIVKLGNTIDDASGEAFDKVSRMLGGPYPGGPWISQMANKFISWTSYSSQKWILKNFWTWKFFKRIRVDKESFNFSFSWVKSQVHNLLTKLKKENIVLTDEIKITIAYEFQESVVDVLTTKLLNIASTYDIQTIAICGWVSANTRLRENIQHAVSNNYKILKPIKNIYSTDNAAMIGVVGLLKYINSL